MTSFKINSCEIQDGDVTSVNVTIKANNSELTEDILVASTQADFIVKQIALCAKAAESEDETYYGSADSLISSSFTELPLGEEITLV